MAGLILVVDDDPVQRRLLQANLKKLGYEPVMADSGETALDILSGPKAARIKAILLDLVMPEMDGIEVLEAMNTKGMGIPAIVQTAQGSVETAVNAMRAGAVDFVVKPAAPERLKVSLQNALKLGALQGEIKRMKRTNAGELTVKEVISASPNMDEVKTIAKKAAASSIPVLIEGESGVGKEMIARAIQGMSTRPVNKLVTVNCGALPENLVESILFGHEKGSFTGASEKHLGKFREADGGTLFLDEVGELPLDMQVKLLRAIQEGEVDPIGAKKPVKVDIRIISATNRDLMQEVREGKFREDLYYRLNVLNLKIPPLRERTEDIPELARHFVVRIAAEEGRNNIRGIGKKALKKLCSYHWPGNIRQLENSIFRAIVLCDGDELGVDEFPQIAETGDDVDLAIPASLAPELEENTDRFVDDLGDVISLEATERQMIAYALEKYDWRMSTIARKLGIGRSTLYRKMRQYGLDEEPSEFES